MLFRKNIQFTRLIKANGRLKEFNFRKSNPQGKIYEVDVSDEQGNRFMFNMQLGDDGWKLKGALLPLWVSEVENSLESAILEEENNEQPYKV